jgi:hypothetical protein
MNNSTGATEEEEDMVAEEVEEDKRGKERNHCTNTTQKRR